MSTFDGSDHYVIDTLPCGNGTLGLGHCPGRSDVNAREVMADLQAIDAWGAGHLLTLLESFELALVGAQSLPDEVPQFGFQWWHLPIEDMAAPDAMFEEGWLQCFEAVNKTLAGGGRVFLHCRGGLGRAGTVAARLLIAHGVEPDTAIATVRAARPGAIETHAQEQYLRALVNNKETP